ncbi:metalloregulator ArsR/SmtB family transcription factor [Variovorax sp. J22R133]|uniref:ArsR/SmtB family transcription factor n=1 Tax=Variovorax brevis TaxID=3053503 RepID=UPI00257854D0|nr:metalloregulator ArsR/SmtB family transcription factor [Variovorax sp. J22R133]MDM0115309.1 metalloregulator ArsR/SmtB family transcription factor [Variovorax sp. J22R133]
MRSLSGGSLDGAAPLFAALGDATRLQIVARLCNAGPQSIVRLTEGGGVSRQAITKHLLALEGVGLVRSGRSGRERVWELEAARLAQARRYLDQISGQWDEAIVRLRALVEAEGEEASPRNAGRARAQRSAGKSSAR